MADEQSSVAIEGLDEAASEIQQPLVRDITWFQPADAKNLEPVSLITGFALVLASSYLAGFQQEAKKTSQNLGRQSFRWLKSVVGGFFHADQDAAIKPKPSADEREAAQLAKDALNTAAALDQESYQRILGETEKQLCAELTKTTAMPKAQAEKLARKIRTATEKHVLSKRRTRK
jgi:hypothetical protein